jgi:hypothetical protein
MWFLVDGRGRVHTYTNGRNDAIWDIIADKHGPVTRYWVGDPIDCEAVLPVVAGADRVPLVTVVEADGALTFTRDGDEPVTATVPGELI